MSAAPDEARVLTSAEISELASLLKGRVGWRGVRALANELGVWDADVRKAIARVRMAPGRIRRLRAALAARATGGIALPSAVKGVQ